MPPSARLAGGHAERGRTLPELLLVLGLVSFLLAFSASAADRAWRRWRLYAASNSVALTLAAARARAALLTSAVAVGFDVASGRYVMVAGVSAVAGGGVRPASKLPRGVVFRCPDGSPAVTFSPPGTSEVAALFDGRGRLQSTSAPAHACIASVDGARRVAVSSAGRVQIDRWSGTAWTR